ncbi:MAG: L-threonylcarbamoyladenylate synthase [Eubacteriales bacterium]
MNSLERLVSHTPNMQNVLWRRFYHRWLAILPRQITDSRDQVSAGLPTVAVRLPSQVPAARAVIQEAGVPLAAPLCKCFRQSQVRSAAAHVPHDFRWEKSTRSLTASPRTIGLESTVITLAEETPVPLRPGAVALEQLQQVLGTVKMADAVLHQLKQGSVAASPGMKYKHYAPKAKLILLEGSDEAFFHYVNAHAAEGVAALCYDGHCGNCLWCSQLVTYGKKDCSSGGRGTAIIPRVA